MIKVVAVVKAKDGLKREDFLDEWQNKHPAFVRKLQGIRRYRQSPAVAHRKQWPFSGMAELWFDSIDDVRIAFAGEGAAALFEHEESFLGSVEWFLAEEHEVRL